MVLIKILIAILIFVVQNYIEEMSQPGTWCDNIIIQAVANAIALIKLHYSYY
jgi:hypothetical protein